MLEYNLKQTLIKFWNKAKQTFALKAELAQPDWNQNDDTQPDYVNNRTHWEEPEIYNEVFSGENPNYTLSGNLTSYQVNSNIPILSEGRHYELNIGEYKFDGICKKYENVAGSYGYYIGNGGISIQGEPDTGEDFIVYTSGRTLSSPEIMWFIMKNDSPSGEYDTLLALHEGGVHRLDKKFLPDDVVYDDDIAQPDWNQNDPDAPGHIKNRTHWKEMVGTDYSSDMDFTQLYYGVNTDDGGKMDYFDYGYARFDVVNQDPEAFIDRSFHRDSTGDPLEGKIEWYDEVETGWFEMYGDGHLIAVLVTDDYDSQSIQFHTVDENGFPVDFTTTPGLYVVNAINGSVEDGEILGLFDFFIDHETIYHTIGKEYLPPVEWDEILNKTHGIEETTGETIVVEASEFTDDDEFCTATFADSYTTCYRKFGLIYEDGWVDEWYGSLKLLKAGETEFIDCSDGIPMFEAGDLLLFGNPHLYDSTFEDNGEPYVAYELVSNQDNHWNIKIDSEFARLEGLSEMDIQDISYIKKLDKVYLPSDTVYQQDLAPVATSNDYNDLDNKPTIPVQPTKTSDLINDGNGDSPLNPFVTADEVAQSDWEQNDENAPDFIKNKICYEKTVTLRGYSNTDTDYITTDEWNFYSIPDIDENFVDSFVGRTISFEYGYEGERQSWNAEVQSAESPETAGDLYKWPSENIYAVYGPEDYDWIVFILEDNTEIYGTTFNKGIIILNYLYGDCNYTISNKIITTIKKIDEKFIPDTIARVSDVPTKTSDLTNDGSDGTSQYVEADDLAVVASTGEYGDLSNAPTKLSEFINDGNGDSPSNPFVTESEISEVGKTGDYGDLSNTPTKLSEFINDGNGDSPSNPFVTENDLEAVQDLISPEASVQNKLISQSEAEEMVQTLSLSPIVADNTGTKSFDFESVMYSSMVPDSTNLEAGPWYKNEGSGFVECGSTSGVYVGLNDSTVVLNDESLFYYFAHGYRYQRIKLGVVGVYGKIKTPYGENVDLIYSDGTGLSGKFAGVPCIYFYDDHNQFGHNSRVIYVCRASNLMSKTNAAEEYLMANATDTINDIAAGTDPDATYDIIYPTTKYVCTQAQTVSSDPVWTYLFTVNDTTFTNDEWAVLKSKATKEKIEQIETNRQAIESLADVAFSGDYDDLDNKLEVEVSQSTTTGGQKQYKRTQITVNGVTTTVDVPVVDPVLSPSSQNPVQNNVIQHELANRLPVERFNELDSIALTTLGIKSGTILEPVKTITDGKRYPNATQAGDVQWRLGVADNDTFYKIYNVSQYNMVHLTAISRAGYILTESLPDDFETRIKDTGSGNKMEYPEPSGTPAGTHSEQANMQPRTGYTPYNLDITTNGRPYLIVYEGNSAQAIVVSYGGGYSPIKTSMFVNDGEGGSPLDPYVTSSDLVASQSDLDYILGN